MSAATPSVYLQVLKVKQAYLFDIGGLLMRIYAYMSALGVIAMLTYSGWSYFMAGTVASVLALAIFLISPQVSRLVDERGQSKVVPWAGAAVALGLALMICNVSLNGSWPICYVAAILMGFVPNPQSLVRSRWTYLLETDRLGADAPTLKAVFTYEGVLDDIGYMVGPSISIALASVLFPCAGMLFGGIAYTLGAFLLLSSHSTEPAVGWQRSGEEEIPVVEESGPKRNMFFESSMVRVLFAIMLFQGMVYGVYDSALVSFGQEQNAAYLISLIMASTSVGSIIAGIVFGMINFKASQGTQLLACSTLFGCLYILLFFAHDMVSLAIVCFVASFSYAPLLITMNTSCERCVPGSRLTESLTWMNTGATLGMTIAPTLGGIFVDVWGSLAGLNFSAACSVAMVVFVLLCMPVIRKHLG